MFDDYCVHKAGLFIKPPHVVMYLLHIKLTKVNICSTTSGLITMNNQRPPLTQCENYEFFSQSDFQ